MEKKQHRQAMLLLLLNMNFIIITLVIILLCFLMFYINLKIKFRIFIAVSNIYIVLNIIFFRKDFKITRKIKYLSIINSLFKKKKKRISFKKLGKLFLVKNLKLYADEFNKHKAFVIEFYVVNKYFNRSVLNE